MNIQRHEQNNTHIRTKWFCDRTKLTFSINNFVHLYMCRVVCRLLKNIYFKFYWLNYDQNDISDVYYIFLLTTAHVLYSHLVVTRKYQSFHFGVTNEKELNCKWTLNERWAQEKRISSERWARTERRAQVDSRWTYCECTKRLESRTFQGL